MNRSPSDFTLLKGKVLHQNDDDDLPIIGKLPDYVHVHLWLVLCPDGIISSWDRNFIDATCFDLVCRGVPHEFFSHLIVMRLDHFKQKFPNVFIPDESIESKQKYSFKK